MTSAENNIAVNITTNTSTDNKKQQFDEAAFEDEETTSVEANLPSTSRSCCLPKILLLVALTALISAAILLFTKHFTTSNIMSIPSPDNDNATVAWYELKFQTIFEDGKQTTVTLTLECYKDWAPKSYERFALLVESGFLDNQFLVRAIPDFVLDFNYGPVGGRDDADKWQAYQNLEWFTPKVDEPPATQHSNFLGTITFGQEEDGRTKTEVFLNVKDNSRLDSLGFWPFGRVVRTVIQSGSGESKTFITTDAKWAAATQAALQMKYGDIFFADGADEKKAAVRQSLLIAGGNEYIAKTYPGLSQLTRVERLKDKPNN